MKLRHKKILEFIRSHNNVSSADILEFLNEQDLSVSEPTIARDLNELLSDGLITKEGKARATRYNASTLNTGNIAFDIDEYFSVPQDERLGPTEFNFDVFSYFDTVFSDDELSSVDKITQEYQQRVKNLLPEQLSKETERLTIDLSWKSSEIEGNTYDLIDTEILIKESKEAQGHSKEEAKMILNHKRAIEYIFANRDMQEVSISKIENLHRLLTEGLDIRFGLRKHKVRIGGTNYHPLHNPHKIQEAMEKAVSIINKLQNPIEKALATVLLISYIQPFGDGNKRTARIVGNAILLSYGMCPLSYRSVGKSEYKRAMLIFYEQQSFYNFKQLFIKQYKFAGENYFV